ncbi:MAG: 3-hydroxyacyl-CoA dehydrogenase, partial [Calditrichaeota bacterium]
MALKIKQITVIGAGTMGHGIAHVSCTGGFRTVVQDVSEEALSRASEHIRKNLAKAVERNLLSQEASQAALQRLSTETDLRAAVEQADFVIEA